MKVTPEITENAAQAYSQIVDKYLAAVEIDGQVDGGEFSGPASDRLLDREIERLFIALACEYAVDQAELEGAVHDFLNAPVEERDYSATPRQA